MCCGRAAEGRLTVDELDERLDAAYGARTRSRLERWCATSPRRVTTHRRLGPDRQARWGRGDEASSSRSWAERSARAGGVRPPHAWR